MRVLLSFHITTVKWMSCLVENFHGNILSGSLKLCSAWGIMWRFHPHWRVIRCLYSDNTQEDLNITKFLLYCTGVEKTQCLSLICFPFGRSYSNQSYISVVLKEKRFWFISGNQHIFSAFNSNLQIWIILSAFWILVMLFFFSP